MRFQSFLLSAIFLNFVYQTSSALGQSSLIDILNSTQITVDGQEGWQHDQGDRAGYFNTFDALDLPGAYRQSRKIHVFLPKDYSSSIERYPVVYMNDGSNVFFADNGQGCWQMAERMGELYDRGTLRKIIVVGIVSPDRNAEYTHESVPTISSCCKLPDYSRYVAEQLKPWIDRNYRTISEGASTGLIGSSHGGLAAFATAMAARGSFGMVAAMSPSFWVGLDPFGPDLTLSDSSLVNWLSPGMQLRPHPRVYIDWGLVRAGGMQNSLIEKNAALRGKEMASLLRGQYGYRVGIDLKTVEDPSGDHSEAAWSRRIAGVLTWMFPNQDHSR